MGKQELLDLKTKVLSLISSINWFIFCSSIIIILLFGLITEISKQKNIIIITFVFH